MTTISDLSNELLELIMSYLPLADKKVASLVCQHWREMSYSAGLIKNEVLTIKNYEDLSNLDGNRRYINIKIGEKYEELQTGEGASQFWSNCGQFVENLQLIGVIWQKGCLSDILPNTPNLRELTLAEYRGGSRDAAVTLGRWFEALTPDEIVTLPQCTFPSLLHLTIDYWEIFPGGWLKTLVANAPVLEEFDLDGEKMDQDLYDSLLFLSNSHGKILKRLRIPWCSVKDAKLTAILSNLGPQMTELLLHSIKGDLGDACLRVIQTNFPNLRKLSLGYCRFTDNGMHNLLLSAKQLTHICLAYAKNVGSLTALAVSTLSGLQSANLSWTPVQFDVRVALGSQPRPLLTELILAEQHDTVKVTDEVMKAILPLLPNLKVLHLTMCLGITNSTVHQIATNCQKLWGLCLGMCINITDISPLNSLEQLEHLSVQGCELTSTFHLKNVKSIAVSPHFVETTRLETLADSCPLLEDAYVRGWERIKECACPLGARPIKFSNNFPFKINTSYENSALLQSKYGFKYNLYTTMKQWYDNYEIRH